MKPIAYYNRDCSICRIEINHYKNKCTSIDWVDINNHEFPKKIKSKNQLLRRLHIKKNDEILIGVDAFIFIWAEIPKYKILSKLLRFPIIYQIAFIAYEFLAFLLFIKNYKQFNK